ncbi:arginase family protein [Neobacillus sp. SM06]|uniref:arginase family protein n=1 Tax=Neobacillus sp. SM06 TaxID=3422492 RepID=UPI003D2854FB
MGLMKKGMTILHFDDTYYEQQRLRKFPHEEIDFEKLQHVNLYCELDSLKILQKKLQKRNEKGITFIGSGNYHYVSFLFLKEITKPFTLVLFDNHPDLGTVAEQEQNLLSCGTWVSYALRELPLLQRVVIIGPTTAMPHQAFDSRVVIFPFDGSHHYSRKSILSAIHTETVYISIDKDVLNRSEAVTNWDQGIMNSETLLHDLAFILKNKQVEGMDVCGEEQISPVQAFLPDFQKVIRKNEEANINILETCLKAGAVQTRGA